jgi:transcriptional regulator with XRE-family HTH domain
VITLTNDRELGQMLRRLRHDAGLSLNDLAPLCHVSKGGLSKREIDSRAMTAGALIETARALGYAVALVPSRRDHAADTVTAAMERQAAKRLAHQARLASGETT